MEQQKQCSRCKQTLPLSEFYVGGTGKLGHRSQCKHCEKVYTDANRDRIVARQKRWYEANRERLSEVQRQQRATPEGREAMRRYSKEQTVREPEKKRARRVISNGIRDGRIVRQPCQFCGNEKSQAHHEDYSKPLEVIWACFKCHREKLHNQVVATLQP